MLLEVVVSILLVALLSVTVISSITFTSRGARLNTNAIAAKNIAQGFFERMAADDFGNVTPPTGGIFHPTNGGYPNIDFSSVPPIWLDRALDIRCRVDIAFKGFGIASSGSTGSLTDSTQSWETDEWAGDTLYLVDGTGAGQFAQIASNTSTALTLASNLSVAPGSTTKYMINNGKTVEITTTWFFQGTSYTETIESLIINYRNDPDFGF